MFNAACKKTEKKNKCLCGRYEGIFYSILAGISFVLLAATAKILKDMNPAELNVYSLGFTFIYSLPWIISGKYSMPTIDKRNLSLWLLLCLFLPISLTARTAAFQILPLGESSSIVFSIPMFTALFSRIILKDRLSWMMIISLVLSFLGLLLTCRLPTIIASSEIGSTQHLIGCAYAFVAVITCAGYLIVVRNLRHIAPAIINAIAAIILVVFSAGFVPAYGGFHNVPCNATIIVAIIGSGFFALLTTHFTNCALQIEDPTTVSIMTRSSDMVLSFVVQILFFKDAAEAYSITGALIVFFCGLLIPLQRWMEGQPEGSRWKNSWLIK